MDGPILFPEPKDPFFLPDSTPKGKTLSSVFRRPQTIGRTAFAALPAFLFCIWITPVPLSHAATAHATWNANPESNIGGYILYYGTATRKYDFAFNIGPVLSYDVPGLLDGVIYYFAVTAYNTSGISSPFSEEFIHVSPGSPVVTGPPASIVVTPSSAMIDPGTTQQYAAVAKDAQGLQLGGINFTWSSSNSGAATVDGAGLAAGVAAGTTLITAEGGGVLSNQAQLQILSSAPPPIPPTVSAVEVAPASATIAEGDILAFQAIARDAQGNQIGGASFTWSSSNAGVAAVDVTGHAAGATAGTTLITAESGGVPSNQARLDVVTSPDVITPPAQPGSFVIEIAPASSTIVVGTAQQFNASATDPQGTEITGLGFIWNSSNAGVAAVDDTGKTTGLAPGLTTLTASADGAASPGALLQVVNETAAETESTVAIIEVSPPSVSLSLNTHQQFAAVAKDSQGNQRGGVEFTWSSNRPDIVSVDEKGLATGVAPGSAVVVAAFNAVLSNPVELSVAAPPQSHEISGGGCGFIQTRGGRPPDFRQIAVNLAVFFAPFLLRNVVHWSRALRMGATFWSELVTPWIGLRAAAVTTGIFMFGIIAEEVLTLFSRAI